MTRFSLLLFAAASAVQAPSIDRMRADLEFLTSPPLEGRGSLTRGSEIAARFLAAEFQKAGLAPVGGTYLQEFQLTGVKLDRENSSVVVGRGASSRTFAPVSVYFNNPIAEVKVSAPVVFAGYGITAPEYQYDDYAGLDVRGKVVLIFDHEPQESDAKSLFQGAGYTRHANVWWKTWNAQEHGAVAVLLATEPLHNHRRPPSEPDRGSAAPQALVDNELKVPRFVINPQTLDELAGGEEVAAKWQEEIDRRLKPVSRSLDARVELKARNLDRKPGPSWNVVGLLEGSDPKLKDETVIYTAHYDHLGVDGPRLYAGANDNGSGTVAVLELARLYAGAKTRPKRSVLFIIFGSEEQLLLGSYYYVAHPLRPLKGTREVINLDMDGRSEDGAPNTLFLIGAVFFPEYKARIEQANQSVHLELSDKYDKEYTTSALFRCDHLPFLLKGIPAVWFFGGWHMGYHTPRDTVERIEFPRLKKIVELARRTGLE